MTQISIICKDNKDRFVLDMANLRTKRIVIIQGILLFSDNPVTEKNMDNGKTLLDIACCKDNMQLIKKGIVYRYEIIDQSATMSKHSYKVLKNLYDRFKIMPKSMVKHYKNF